MDGKYHHVTRQGTKEFGLTNTNKLIRSYEGCVGLKTGSTSIAKYCLSAVAKRNDITLIAVVMAAPDYKVRFKDAASMLNYGFSKCSLYIDKKMEALPEVPVRNGKKKTVSLVYEEQFHYLDTTGQNIGNVKRKLRIHREVKAPVEKNDLAGDDLFRRWEGTGKSADPLRGKCRKSHISGLPENSHHEIVNVTENRVNSNL